MPAPIPFNLPARTGTENAHVVRALAGTSLTAGPFHDACRQALRARLGCGLRLTPSCTHALEMAALLLELRPGDEVIMPSFTFVSTANAFAMHGAVPVFVDIRPDTLNMDAACVEAALTPRTRAIIAMHYAGVACDMDALLGIAAARGLPVIEDAAHALFARWKGAALGTLGALGTISFHETKILTSGEGGALLLNDARFAARADYLQHKGTNRTAFLDGRAGFYSWVDSGSSWSMGELNAAYLYGNLQSADAILARRMALWNRYHEAFAPLQDRVTLPHIPDGCTHNASAYYLKLADAAARDAFMAAMRAAGIEAVFHYIPLHSAPAGRSRGRFHGRDRHTTAESRKLVRLPLYYNLGDPEQERVIAAVRGYFGS